MKLFQKLTAAQMKSITGGVRDDCPNGQVYAVCDSYIPLGSGDCAALGLGYPCYERFCTTGCFTIGSVPDGCVQREPGTMCPAY